MKKRETIQIITQNLNRNVAVISSLGLISRELFDLKDSPQNFYMTGSMGLAASIGLGVAISKSNLKVVIIDGDGSLLMNLGSLATAGHFKPKNLIHIVLDNEAYESCSKEPSVSKTANLHKLAEIVGYNVIKKVNDPLKLKKMIGESLIQNGPIFILAKIEFGGQRNLPRILKLDRITERFKQFLLQFK